MDSLYLGLSSTTWFVRISLLVIAIVRHSIVRYSLHLIIQDPIMSF